MTTPVLPLSETVVVSTAGRPDNPEVVAARARRIPVALSMAGGYGHDLATTVAVQVTTLNVAAASWAVWQRMKESAA